MDDERWEPGMPVLDRQPVRDEDARPPASVRVPAGRGRAALDAHAGSSLPPSLRGLPPRSVPEVAPTPLQKHFVLLSAPALVAGAIAITALELGAGFGHPLVKLCVLVAGPLLLATTADATVRIWRSAWAWMPVDRGRGLFRLTWVLVSVIFLALIILAMIAVLSA
jgi:hypothetical protein